MHRRRPGFTVGRAPAPVAYEGGEAPCALDRVRPERGRMAIESAPVFCSACGERFPAR